MTLYDVRWSDKAIADVLTREYAIINEHMGKHDVIDDVSDRWGPHTNVALVAPIVVRDRFLYRHPYILRTFKIRLHCPIHIWHHDACNVTCSCVMSSCHRWGHFSHLFFYDISCDAYNYDICYHDVTWHIMTPSCHANAGPHHVTWPNVTSLPDLPIGAGETPLMLLM